MMTNFVLMFQIPFMKYFYLMKYEYLVFKYFKSIITKFQVFSTLKMLLHR
jgi:hypothetical protein